MADQDKKPASGNGESGPTDADGDGYRRSHRLKKDDRAASSAGPKAEPDRKLTAYQAFMEQHWESWLGPVLMLVGLGGGALGYKFHIIPEGMAGTVLAGGAVAVAIYSVAQNIYNLIQKKGRKYLFLALALLWGFSSAFPTLRKSVPPQVLAEAVLTDGNKTQKLAIPGHSGPFDLVVTGKIKGQNQQAIAAYELTVSTPGGAAETIEDSLEYAVHQTRTRRGSTQWTESHNQNIHRLPARIGGHELTLSVEKVDDLLENGLRVQVTPQSTNPWIFWGLGIFVVLCMFVVEATVGDAKEKTHAIMTSMGTLIFAWRFFERATPVNLVAPAVEAGFLALIVGGVGGTFLGWIVRKVSGRDKVRPPKPAHENRGEKKASDEAE